MWGLLVSRALICAAGSQCTTHANRQRYGKVAQTMVKHEHGGRLKKSGPHVIKINTLQMSILNTCIL
jgi:hypothetical protein